MATTNTAETVLWAGKPSQALALRAYTLRGGAFGLLFELANYYRFLHPQLWLLLAVPVAAAVWTFIKVRHISYEITTQRVRCWTGVFNRALEEVEFYRARETHLYMPLVDRVFGVGNAIVAYADSTGPHHLMLAGIHDADGVRNLMRSAIESVRTQKGVRAVEASW